jgi:cyclopropane fatty-acyl-phospholipid synthase-like methyltransferase
MNENIPARIRWAIEILDLQPDDRLLELGCGGGAAVSLACERLRSGSITAIDRSPTMVARATERNAENIASGRARIELGEVQDLELEQAAFTKVFAVNVNLFWTRSPAEELDSIRRLLEPDGLLYLFYEAPSASKAASIGDALAKLPGATPLSAASPSFVGVVARP